jgi:hypothetical protein
MEHRMDTEFDRRLAASQASAPAGARRAALALHSLGASDRAWLLERLLAPQQALVRPLLDELARIGLPPHAQTVAALRAAPPSADVHGRAARRTPARPAPHTLFRNEPDRLVEDAVGLGLLPTTSGPTPRATAVTIAARGVEAAGVPPRRAQALGAAVERRLVHHQHNASDGLPLHRLRAWIGRLRSTWRNAR